MLNRSYLVTAALLLLGLVPLVGCSQPQTRESTQTTESAQSSDSADVLQVTVSIPPQKYFVERVGGERVEVNVMLPPGASPATYEPTPQQLRRLDEADAYARIHVPFENAWMDRIRSANSDMLVVDLTQEIDRMPMAGSHHHGNAEHHHGEVEEVKNPDPHIWLSPPLVKEQAQTIYEALVQLDPDHQQEYRANLDRFIADLETLDREIEQTLSAVENEEFMVFHPAWGYFARAYDLEMIPIEVGGTEPSAAQMSKLITKAKEENIDIIFAQPQFSTKDAETIAQEIGGEVLLIDPLSSDWMENMRQVANTFEKVLSKKAAIRPQIVAIAPQFIAVIGHR